MVFGVNPRHSRCVKFNGRCRCDVILQWESLWCFCASLSRIGHAGGAWYGLALHGVAVCIRNATITFVVLPLALFDHGQNPSELVLGEWYPTVSRLGADGTSTSFSRMGCLQSKTAPNSLPKPQDQLKATEQASNSHSTSNITPLVQPGSSHGLSGPVANAKPHKQSASRHQSFGGSPSARPNNRSQTLESETEAQSVTLPNKPTKQEQISLDTLETDNNAPQSSGTQNTTIQNHRIKLQKENVGDVAFTSPKGQSSGTMKDTLSRPDSSRASGVLAPTKPSLTKLPDAIPRYRSDHDAHRDRANVALSESTTAADAPASSKASHKSSEETVKPADDTESGIILPSDTYPTAVDLGRGFSHVSQVPPDPTLRNLPEGGSEPGSGLLGLPGALGDLVRSHTPAFSAIPNPSSVPEHDQRRSLDINSVSEGANTMSNTTSNTTAISTTTSSESRLDPRSLETEPWIAASEPSTAPDAQYLIATPATHTVAPIESLIITSPVQTPMKRPQEHDSSVVDRVQAESTYSEAATQSTSNLGKKPSAQIMKPRQGNTNIRSASPPREQSGIAEVGSDPRIGLTDFSPLLMGLEIIPAAGGYCALYRGEVRGETLKVGNRKFVQEKND